MVHNQQQKVLALLESSGPGLHALLGKLTLSEDTVGDLIQELFLRLSQSKGFARADDPVAYAYRAAINLAFEWRRKTKKIRFESLDESFTPVSNKPSPLTEMIQAEKLVQVLDVMPRLNTLAQEVVTMRYIEEVSYDTIAQRLGKKPQHIRSVSAKAIARLRQLLNTKQ